MANFNITVETGEMAHAINGVSSHVNAVTTAVVGMQTAVLAAEAAAANRVCNHVDRGFFSLIRSQITQKIARLRSEVDSKFLEMRQQSQFLAAIKGRMERDYQMIAARYTRLFHAIDLSLRNRVLELDKAVSQLLHREVERIHIRLRSMQALAPVHQIESVQSAQVIASSHSKANAYRAIEAMHSFLSDSSRQGTLVQSMLFVSAPGRTNLHYIPVMLLQTEASGVAAPGWEVRVAPGATDAVSEKVNAGVQSAAFSVVSTLKWRPADSESRNRVASETAG